METETTLTEKIFVVSTLSLMSWTAVILVFRLALSISR